MTAKVAGTGAKKGVGVRERSGAKGKGVQTRSVAPGAKAPVDPVTSYARAVGRGEIAACKWVKLACARHLRDLREGKKRGLRFDVSAAEWALEFFETVFQHSKGEWAGTAVHLEPWEQFIIGSVHGWMRADGTRRFREVYIEIPRKNGKSFLASGEAIVLTFFDGEAGAEGYAAATKRDQARIVWDEAKRMVKKSPFLSRRIRTLVANMHDPSTESKFEPLGADDDSMDGLNPQVVVIDELHAHKNRKVVDVLRTATGARRQPLIFKITTAGYDRRSVCWQEHEYACNVLEEIFTDDEMFGYIATIDEGDDWTQEAVWRKANPNFGVSIKPENMAAAVRRAVAIPGEQNAFLRLRLNVWTEQESRWLSLEDWNACGGAVDPYALVGRDCWLGLDLSNTIDLTAAAVVFAPDEEDVVDIVMHFWIPEESMRNRSLRDRVPYDVWVKDGFISATPGNVVDYDQVERDILEIGAMYHPKEVAIDPFNATQVSAHLIAAGLNVVDVRQGYLTLNAPTKELGRRVVSKGLRHGGNPVLTWNASNVVVQQDPSGNIKPDKGKSIERIDGVSAVVNALGRMLLGGGETSTGGMSVYVPE